MNLAVGDVGKHREGLIRREKLLPGDLLGFLVEIVRAVTAEGDQGCKNPSGQSCTVIDPVEIGLAGIEIDAR